MWITEGGDELVERVLVTLPLASSHSLLNNNLVLLHDGAGYVTYPLLNNHFVTWYVTHIM